MSENSINHREVWKGIFSFLALLTLFSSICHYAIVKFNPASIYVGALMLCPSLSAILTLKIMRRPILSLPWNLKNWKYIQLAYLTPVMYISIAYILLWIFGFGRILNEETLLGWSSELGLAVDNIPITLAVMSILLAVVGVIKNIGSTLGEEIGWRGFLIFELRKVLPFEGVSIVSGLIWSIWHWPLIIKYGGGNTIFQLSCFTVMILGMSTILTYYTFKANSLWPAAIFHSVHNVYIQKIFTPITIKSEDTSFWIDEYGLMLPIVISLFAIYFWRKARMEQLELG